MFVVFGKALWVSYTAHLHPRGAGHCNFNTSNFVLNFVQFKCLLAKTVTALYSGI